MKAEEKAKELYPHRKLFVDTDGVGLSDSLFNQCADFRREGYIKGYEDGYQSGLDEFALAEIQAFQKGLAQKDAEWQEKMRWKSVEEKLPEYYHVVLLKTESYTFMGWRASNGEESFYTIYCSDTIMHQKVTHWREIIE